MSSIKLKGSTSGEITISAPAVAGTNTLTLPAETGTVLTTNNFDLNGQELILDADGDTSITADTDDQIDFKTGGTDRFEIDSSGNVEVLNGNFTIDKSSTPNLLFRISDTEKAYIRVNTDDLEFNCSSGSTLFRAGGTERMKINSNGRVDIGTGSYTNGAKLTLSYTSTTEQGIRCADTVTSGTHTQIQFLRGGTQVGKIECANQASTAYVTSSDYRMKENVNYSWDATTKLKQLKPAEFTWKEEFDTNKTQVQGFLAHEVSSIVPEAVSGTKDATKQEDVFNDDGVKTGTKTVPDYQGIDQSKLVPLLVKTCQEQQTIIEDLQTRITALENN